MMRSGNSYISDRASRTITLRSSINMSRCRTRNTRICSKGSKGSKGSSISTRKRRKRSSRAMGTLGW